MRSLVRQREVAEWALRAVAIAALLVALWRMFAPPPSMPRVSEIRSDLPRALESWSAAPAPESLRVAIEQVPAAGERDWLRALRRAGSAIEWRVGDGVAPIVVAASPVRSPRGGTRVSVAAPPGSRVILSDDAGTIDSLTTNDGAAISDVGAVRGAVAVALGRSLARTPVPPAVVPRPIVLLARAGWEGKFVAAALEEDGWSVRARFAVAPNTDVAQGELSSLDTSTTSAVVVLDSSAWPELASIGRFVRSGGGLVVAGDGARTSALRSLLPGVAGREQPGIAGAMLGPNPRRGLPLLPLVRLTSDAVPVERREGATAAAGRRIGAGRVVQIGYGESWRWRMAGDDASPAAHRRWWSDVVASVAYAPAALPNDAAGTAAPYARLVGALGPPSTATRSATSSVPSRTLPWWLFVIPVAALLAEWASRRFRGAA